MKKSTVLRVPIEYDSLVKKWKDEAAKAGTPMSTVEIQRRLAQNMRNYRFKPGRSVFSEEWP